MEAINFIKTYHKPYLGKINNRIFDNDNHNYNYYYYLYYNPYINYFNHDFVFMDKIDKLLNNKLYFPKLEIEEITIRFGYLSSNTNIIIINYDCINLNKLIFSFCFRKRNYKIIFNTTLSNLENLIFDNISDIDIIFNEIQLIKYLEISYKSKFFDNLNELFIKLPKLEIIDILFGESYILRLKINTHNKIIKIDKINSHNVKKYIMYKVNKFIDKLEKSSFKIKY